MSSSDRLPAYAGLPGHELVVQGVDDLDAGRETAPALLVAMASARLRETGVRVPDTAFEAPSHRLYDLLARAEPDDAHARYNALVRRLVSFARAAEHAAPR